MGSKGIKPHNRIDDGTELVPYGLRMLPTEHAIYAELFPNPRARGEMVAKMLKKLSKPKVKRLRRKRVSITPDEEVLRLLESYEGNTSELFNKAVKTVLKGG